LIGRFVSAALTVAILGFYSAAAAPASPPTQISWHRDGLLTWERVEHRSIAPKTIHQLTPKLAPGRSKVLAAGSPGVLEARVRYAQRDGGPVRSSLLWATVVRAPKARVLADGIGESSLAEFEAHGIAKMSYIARSAMLMVATAYTAGSAGGGGMTAIGRPAGHGIVAVDPRVIPLGTRLYIPGYGVAVAGDTGGAIVGHRIDLGFDSLRDAMIFGRRDVTVYRLK
jgi:3D (Asp-Asp-Asp) domain-containing protein